MDIKRFLESTKEKPVRIAIIGDLCLDLAYHITTEQAEISVETGLQTYSVVDVKPELGGACNVAVNCKSLGADIVDVYGIVGEDFYGNVLLDLLAKKGVGTDGVAVQKDRWNSHVYHKSFDRGVELPRFDIGNFNCPSQESLDFLITTLSTKLDRYDAIIINEQVPQGLHSLQFQEMLNHVIAASPTDLLWFADCRRLNKTYRDTIHKLNEQEGRALFGSESESKGRKKLVRDLADFFGKPVVLTLGADGALAYENGTATRILGIHFTGKIDPVGAGDAFLAGMVVGSCRGAGLADAAYIGNLSAGVSLTVLYECGHPTVEDVLALSRKADWRYHPEIAEDIRLATYWENSPLEIISPKNHGDFPKIAIFDHDGTISTLRQGWEAVMARTMLSSITGTAYSRLSPDELTSINDDIRQFIDRTTGIQTIEQMHHLVEMVRRYGYVAQHDILSAEGYKAIYNERLLSMVRQKTTEIEAGRLCPDDVTIKGSVAFLEYLAEHGTELYLASGTDVEDVKREAELLGYAPYFQGRIFGSVGDMENDPKRLVIRQIIEQHLSRSDSENFVVFGDGPVEMREAKRHGLLAIGILSDEVRRYGANMAKRKRLVLGGADLLIPDFSHRETLAEYLGWGR